MMEFIWDDGGRADCGYVGLAGDCVTRAIAVATGVNYRDVYKQLGQRAEKTPRNGLARGVIVDYLESHGWNQSEGSYLAMNVHDLPKGPVVVRLADPRGYRSGHVCCVVDHVIYDTWNPSDDDDYVIAEYWTRPPVVSESSLPAGSRHSHQTAEQTLTQQEFDKVLKRLRALDNTAINAASTEGEKRNALRMMQNLMLRHNLSREDINGDDNVDSMRFTRIACPVNGRRAYSWEKSLASYLVSEIFPMADWYFSACGHRTLFWFFGPLDDVKNCLALFRELLLTIAASARLQYGGYSRGSGASYAEGYVRGLPRYQQRSGDATGVVSESALIQTRTLAVKRVSRKWLELECDVRIYSSSGSGRYGFDPDAADRGKEHGATHDLSRATGQKRITAG